MPDTPMTAAAWIDRLGLLPHPEGGWYRETYRAVEGLAAEALPERYEAGRSLSTAIYFLLERDDFSAFHRVRSDEVWHHYAGVPVRLYVLTERGLDEYRLGTDIRHGELPQLVLPANTWFAAQPLTHEAAGDDFALVGCTVAPGFDYADFELADRAELIGQHPDHAATIETFTRI